MSNQAKPKSKKLTQTERSAITKHKLIEATVESLVELGYSKTSTQVICDKAGLSKGGLFRQYASRTALMIDTARHIYGTIINPFAKLNAEEIKVEALFLMVQQHFKKPEFQAALELTIASRTDRQLNEGLIPIIQHNIDSVLSIARSLFPSAARNNPRFDAVIHLLVLAFQGEVVDAIIYNGEELAKARVEFLLEVAKRELTG